MASSDGGELGNAIQRATDWLDNQPGSNKNVIKVLHYSSQAPLS